MAFLRVVELFQPLFPAAGGGVDLKGGLDSFVEGARALRGSCDLAVVGEHKDDRLLRFSSVQAAALLQREAGVEAAAVIVARDSNRPQVLSTILTACGLGLRNLMLAWGDPYPAGGPRNAYDFRGLSEVIAEARGIAERAGVAARLLAPVDVESLSSGEGAKLARERVAAGADLLLAQPPTTDSRGELARHSRLVADAGLKDRVLLNAFPFRGADDVARCEEFFGWSLPPSLKTIARSGPDALLGEAAAVVGELRRLGLPGAYVSTRGNPGLALRLLS